MPVQTAEATTVEELVKQAAAEATLLLPDGDRVRLRRIDGKKPTKALLAEVQAADPALVAQELRDLGFAYIRVVERLAAEHVDADTAFRIAAMAWVHSRVSSDRIMVLPPDFTDD